MKNSKTVGIIGSGMVGQHLAAGFLKHGYEVWVGTGNPDKLKDWQFGAGKGAHIGSFADAAQNGDIIVLAVKGAIAKALLDKLPNGALTDKIIMDATNPIAESGPVNGVLTFFTDINRSLMEDLQETIPAAKFVKAFSSVGAPFMVDPDFGGQQPTMFICGNDDAAKKNVAGIVEAFGWEAEDMGKAEAARAIEPLCMLWCIPGFRENRWSHAFKLLKQ